MKVHRCPHFLHLSPLNNIFIFHGLAMLINGNNTIFTSETHWLTVDHVGLF